MPAMSTKRLPFHLSSILAAVICRQYFTAPPSFEMYSVRIDLRSHPVPSYRTGVTGMGNVDILTILIYHDSHNAGSADGRCWALLITNLFTGRRIVQQTP